VVDEGYEKRSMTVLELETARRNALDRFGAVRRREDPESKKATEDLDEGRNQEEQVLEAGVAEVEDKRSQVVEMEATCMVETFLDSI